MVLRLVLGVEKGKAGTEAHLLTMITRRWLTMRGHLQSTRVEDGGSRRLTSCQGSIGCRE